jgi:hypothetical protein
MDKMCPPEPEAEAALLCREDEDGAKSLVHIPFMSTEDEGPGPGIDCECVIGIPLIGTPNVASLARSDDVMVGTDAEEDDSCNLPLAW